MAASVVEQAEARNELGEEELRLAALVLAALPGWCNVDLTAVVVEEKSGEGANMTYKVSAPLLEPPVVPPAVALHMRGEETVEDTLCEPRTAAAARVFAKAGLGPARLAEHEDQWFIEPWEGVGEPDLTAERVGELAALVARIHRLPASWFDPWRERLCVRRPELRGVPPGSHVWWWTARDTLVGELTDECRQVWLSADFFAPASRAASRVVTAHSDLHAGNMIQTDAGILVLDFEYTCATHAVQDISFVCENCCGGDLARKKAFVSAYLREMGDPAELADVDDLLFDCAIAVLGSHMGPLDLWFAGESPELWLRRFDMFRTFVSEARSSAALRRALVEKGVRAYVEELRGQLCVGAPVVLCHMASDGDSCWRFVLGRDGTMSPEALQSSLCLGLAADGAGVSLVERGDCVRRLIFVEALSAAAAVGRPPATCSLAIASPAGCGVVARQGYVLEGQPVKGLAVGPVSQTLVVDFDGAYIRLRGSPAQALRAGDPREALAEGLSRQLYAAAERGDALAMEGLIARGADVNREREDRAGHVAAREGHLAVLEVLLVHGYDFNHSSGSEKSGSALIEATTYGHSHCVRRLLQVPGLDLGLMEDEKTAAQWAVDPSPYAEPTAAHAEIAQLLEEAAGRQRTLESASLAVASSTPKPRGGGTPKVLKSRMILLTR